MGLHPLASLARRDWYETEALCADRDWRLPEGLFPKDSCSVSPDAAEAPILSGPLAMHATCWHGKHSAGEPCSSVRGQCCDTHMWGRGGTLPRARSCKRAWDIIADLAQICCSTSHKLDGAGRARWCPVALSRLSSTWPPFCDLLSCLEEIAQDGLVCAGSGLKPIPS